MQLAGVHDIARAEGLNALLPNGGGNVIGAPTAIVPCRMPGCRWIYRRRSDRRWPRWRSRPGSSMDYSGNARKVRLFQSQADADRRPAGAAHCTVALCRAWRLHLSPSCAAASAVAIELVTTTLLFGYDAIGIADRNTLAGVVRMHSACAGAGLRPLIGCRLDRPDAPSLLAYPVVAMGMAASRGCSVSVRCAPRRANVN